jgi:pimeloyl-ACP methyl ester carboxylesterase
MKPLALLIPGLDGTGRLYCRQVPALSERYRVLPWEFRRRTRFDFEDLVAELGEGTADEQPGSMVVAGESFGGPVAISFALAFPERVRSLLLINTFAVYRRRVRIRLACRLSGLLPWPGIRQAKDIIAGALLALEGVPREGRAAYFDTIRRIDLRAYRRRLELVRDVDLTSRLQEIGVPTLIFAAGRDKVVPSAAEARFMASRIPGSVLHEFPRAGHALLLTPGFSLASYV